MKQKLLFLQILLFASCCSFSQGIAIGAASPDSSAVLDITNTAKGLLIPRMRTNTILTISNPARGLLVYDTLANQLMVNKGTRTVPNWQPIVSVNPGWELAGNAGTNPVNQYIGTIDNQPVLFKVNDIRAGELNPGTRNVFFGLRAGQFDSIGVSNIGIGADALRSNTSGHANTASGDSSLFSNTTGNLNTASGSQALFANTGGFQNTAMGAGALRLNTTGSDCTALGMNALFSNTTGFVNTATGFAALFSNTTGSFNTAHGEFALHDNTTGVNNTASGNFALQSNSTGGQNTAMGVAALKLNTTGGDNVGIGVNALSSNTTGVGNISVGNFALNNNTIGGSNVAIGHSALANNTTGVENTAIGNFAMQGNKTGRDNVAIGINALINDTIGASNIAVGDFAGDQSKADNNNTFLGFGANNTSGIALSNSTALGAQTSVTASNQVRLGNAAVTSIGGVVGFTNLSDGRYKLNVQDAVKGIDFVMKLRPVTYQLDIAAVNRKLNPTGKQEAVYKNGMDENSKTIFSGFVAQDVERAAKEVGYDFSGVDKPKNENDLYGLRYSEFVVPLVKAMQQQQQMISEMQKVNSDQKNLINDLLKRIEKLESPVKGK